MQSFFDEVSSRWPAGREDYHWHVLWDEPQGAQLADPYVGLLAGTRGLEPVEPRWLHLTVLHSGPVEQISEAEIKAITARVAYACTAVEPWEAIIDRPSVGRVAVECMVRPGSPARRLWEITAAATREVIGDRFPVIPAAYYPHISLAYGIGGLTPEDTAAVRREMKIWLSDDMSDAVRLPVTRLCLVAQRHDGHAITWRPIAEIPLRPFPPKAEMTREAIEAEYLE